VTPAARLQAAIDLLQDVAATARPADGTASAWLRERRYIGSKDRRVITERVWGMLRRWARIAWWLDRVAPGGEPLAWDTIPPRHRLIADLMLVDHLDPTQVHAQFTGERHAPAPLSAREAALVDALRGQPLTHPEQPAWVQGEVPEWVIPHLEPLYGDHTAEVLGTLNEPAPVDLRVNTLKGDLEHAISRLAAEGIDTVPTRWSPLGLRLEGRANLAATATFREGVVEVQDEGSQIVALLADARPGMTVIDFCAGAGGKTLAMAAQMRNKGRLIACDVSQGRLDRSATRLKRAGVHNVTRRVLSSESDKWVKRHKGSADRVLVDAPCTGTGTWRRNPDAKWRLDEAEIARLGEVQSRILRSAARLVKPGGRLIYVTCSLLHEENEAQIDRFMADHAEDFRILPVASLWPDTVGGHYPTEGPYLRLDPARHGTDGFFAAILERAV